MDFRDFITTQDDENRRLDRILKRIFEGYKPVKIDQSLRKGLIKLNGKKAEASAHVLKGDVISIAEFLFEENTNPRIQKLQTKNAEKQQKLNQDYKNSKKLEDIFKNQHIRIINKPYGVSSQPAKGEELDLSFIIQKDYEAENPNNSLSFKTGPLHRLDKNTTGLLAFSQSALGARWFSEKISTHEIKKTYLGIVQGKFTGSHKWVDLIQELPQNTTTAFHKVKVWSKEDYEKLPDNQKNPPAKEAVTTATALTSGFLNALDVTLVQFDIETGRKHQIRSQSSFHGFPLLCDTAYNAKKLPGRTSIFLHAARLSFPKENPLSLPEEITAPLPEDFQNFLKYTLINWNGNFIIL